MRSTQSESHDRSSPRRSTSTANQRGSNALTSSEPHSGHVSAVTGGAVRSLAIDGTRVYLGGDFSKIANVTRQRLGAVTAATGALDTVFLPGTANLAVNDMVVQGSWLYLAGDFTKVNAITHNRLARVDTVNGALDATLTQ